MLIGSTASPLWRLTVGMSTRACPNHCKVMKAENVKHIPRKLTANLESSILEFSFKFFVLFGSTAVGLFTLHVRIPSFKCTVQQLIQNGISIFLRPSYSKHRVSYARCFSFHPLGNYMLFAEWGTTHLQTLCYRKVETQTDQTRNVR